MKKVQDGDYVTVHYTGKLSNGEVFDTSRGKHPMEIHVGSGTVIPGFDKALDFEIQVTKINDSPDQEQNCSTGCCCG